MMRTQLIADWLNEKDFGFEFNWRPGPEQLEFDVANTSSTITRVPGGAGLGAEGTEDTHQVLVLVRTGKELADPLEVAMDLVDRALLDVSSVMIWGTYIQFVDRQGDVLPEFDAPERVTYGATYTIREGR